MKKGLKMLAIASALVIIFTISLSSVAMAAGPGNNSGTCCNPDCPQVCPDADCPNADCPCDGNPLGLQHQYGRQGLESSTGQYRYRSCQVE